MVDLRVEAAAQVRRASEARRLTRAGDAHALAQLEADGPWIMRARRTPTRLSLGARIVLVWRVAYEDAGGRLIESTVVPLALEFPRDPSAPRRPRRSTTSALIRALESRTRPFVETTRADWQQEAEIAAGCLASARLTRERAIAALSADVGGAAYQSGLFDRRAERQHGGAAAAAAAARAIVADRLARIDRSAMGARRPPQLLLAIVP